MSAECQLKTARQLNGTHILLLNDRRVGWVKSIGKSFSLHLDGYYWRKGEPNKIGGAVGQSGYRRMRYAVAHAMAILSKEVGAK